MEAYTATGFPNCKNGLNDTERNTNLVLAAIVFRDGLNGNSWTDVNEITVFSQQHEYNYPFNLANLIVFNLLSLITKVRIEISCSPT